MAILTFFGQNQATMSLLIYKIILKHQEKEINQFLKQEQIIVNEVRLTFFQFQFIQTQSAADKGHSLAVAVTLWLVI